MNPETTDAFQILLPPERRPRLLLTCEHATNRLPEPWSWSPRDVWLRDTHWAWDIGAAAITRSLAEHLGAAAVLARFSRVLVDPNRPMDAPDLFIERAEGRPVRLNRSVTQAERQRRVDGYYRPLHDAIDRVAQWCVPELIVAIHSFTPVFDGVPREVEIGILHHGQATRAERWRAALAVASDHTVCINEPYPGEPRLIYSIFTHARNAPALRGESCPGLELELSQKLLTDATSREALAPLLARLLGDDYR